MVIDNFIQHLKREELESLSEALVVGISAHLDWLASINHILLCGETIEQEYCKNNNSIHECQFGNWYFHVENRYLLDDDVFKRMGDLYEKMKLSACHMVNHKKESKPIHNDCYMSFVQQQKEFFDVLLSMSKDCSESLGDIDFLTGLPNRRAFYQLIEKEYSRNIRHQKGLCVAIADIDFFKKINDQYGHDAGDKVLVEIAKCFSSSIREYDTVARYGGEEFVFCMPDCDLSSAKDILERTRQIVEQHSFDIGLENPVKITCSLGVDCFSKEESITQALASADQCLYQAKLNGRNRVVADN